MSIASLARLTRPAHGPETPRRTGEQRPARRGDAAGFAHTLRATGHPDDRAPAKPVTAKDAAKAGEARQTADAMPDTDPTTAAPPFNTAMTAGTDALQSSPDAIDDPDRTAPRAAHADEAGDDWACTAKLTPAISDAPVAAGTPIRTAAKRDPGKPVTATATTPSGVDATTAAVGPQPETTLAEAAPLTADSPADTSHPLDTSQHASVVDQSLNVTGVSSSDMSAAHHAAAPQTAMTAPESSGSALGPVSAGNLKDWLAQPIVHLVASSRREMAIQLRPPELGEVMVRVAVNGRNVSAWFDTPQPQVQQALMQAIPQLHTDLGNAGYSLTGAWVGADGSTGGSQQPGVPAPAPGRAETRGRGLSPGLSVTRRAASGAAGGVNLYV